MSISTRINHFFIISSGPVFRAENSNTHRHLCEFTGLDIEMTIKEHYEEILDLLDLTFQHIFDGLTKHCATVKSEHHPKIICPKIKRLNFMLSQIVVVLIFQISGDLFSPRSTSCFSLPLAPPCTPVGVLRGLNDSCFLLISSAKQSVLLYHSYMSCHSCPSIYFREFKCSEMPVSQTFLPIPPSLI